MPTIALAGDTMLGRTVASKLLEDPEHQLFDHRVVDEMRTADAVLLNLECCISDRGERWEDPAKPFFFRAPPLATARMRDVGVDAVTLANNHALDFGETALLDTVELLDEVGIRHVGAGATRDEARTPATFTVDGLTTGVVGGADHPLDFAAGAASPGIALWEHQRNDDWLPTDVTDLRTRVDVAIATVHWGPNMTRAPSKVIRDAATRLVDAGASLVAGHSAHVFHGVQWFRREGREVPVLYDLGDFIDDYAVDRALRNDLGLLWFVHLDETGTVESVEALPLVLDHCHTRVADGPDRRWIADRLTAACAELDTVVVDAGDRLSLPRPGT